MVLLVGGEEADGSSFPTDHGFPPYKIICGFEYREKKWKFTPPPPKPIFIANIELLVHCFYKLQNRCLTDNEVYSGVPVKNSLPRYLSKINRLWYEKRTPDVARNNIIMMFLSVRCQQVPIVGQKTCRDAYQQYTITENMLCAGYPAGRSDTCTGDSGGPLLCRMRGRWTVVGVTSFGVGCGRRGKYGIYASVANQVQWIAAVITPPSGYHRWPARKSLVTWTTTAVPVNAGQTFFLSDADIFSNKRFSFFPDDVQFSLQTIFSPRLLTFADCNIDKIGWSMTDRRWSSATSPRTFSISRNGVVRQAY